jgi:hypothetical protein
LLSHLLRLEYGMISCVDCDAFTNITGFFGLLFCILVGCIEHAACWLLLVGTIGLERRDTVGDEMLGYLL